MSRFVAPCLFLTMLWGTTPASADAAAEALFRAGREALKRGSFVEACARFEESYRLEPAVGTLLNLALCEERRGRIARAWELFSRAASDLPPGDARVELAREHLTELSRRVPTVVFRSASPSDGLELSLDGLRLGSASLGVALPIDPGRHVVEVRVDAELVERRVFDVVESGKYVLDLASGARQASSKREPQPGATAATRSAERTVGIIALGGASSLFVVGGVSGFAAIQAKAVVDDECDARMECSSEGVAAASRGKTMSMVSTGAFVLGLGALGAGLWWLLRDPDGTATPTRDRDASGGVSLSPDGLKLAF